MLDPPGDRYVDIKMKDDLNKILKDHLSGKAHAYLFFVGLMYICFLFKGTAKIILIPPRNPKQPEDLCLMGKVTRNWSGLLRVSLVQFSSTWVQIRTFLCNILMPRVHIGKSTILHENMVRK